MWWFRWFAWWEWVVGSLSLSLSLSPLSLLSFEIKMISLLLFSFFQIQKIMFLSSFFLIDYTGSSI